jgi:hypothetical protein
MSTDPISLTSDEGSSSDSTVEGVNIGVVDDGR